MAEHACRCRRNGGSVWWDAGSPGEPWDVGPEEALSIPEHPAGGGCGANSIRELHPRRFSLIQRETLQEIVFWVCFPLIWVSAGFGLAAALLCYKT